jgi:hypothetical protein
MWEAMKSFQVVFWLRLGAGADPVSAKDVSHRLIGNGMAEIGQSSDNAVVSPTGVLSGEADNQRLHLGGHRWPAR